MNKIVGLLFLVAVVAVVWFLVGAIVIPLIGLVIRVALTVVLVAVIIYFVRNKGNTT